MAAQEILAAVENLAIVPVVEIDDAANAVPLAHTLAEAGLPVLEVTFRTPAARDAVAAIAAALPDFLVGAGTLVLPAMVAAAAEAGARFGVSPGLSASCLAVAAEHGLPFVPGAVTPSEVGACLEAGLTHIKFFPAGAYGGSATLRALDGPFGWAGARFMPTGGVRPDNVLEYLELPNVFAVGGTWIATRHDVAVGNWDAIAGRARSAVALATAG
jgi:2-dehydro-3-deoxyphosphogluconate aldolase/(4S)-4-hydroxy-2-oxoglutarate aldolase